MTMTADAKGPLPALSDSAWWRLFMFTALYIAQGVPIGLLIYAIPSYLAHRDVSATLIGSYLAMATLPYSIKLFLGPVMDRWTYRPMGRRRPWVLIAQTGIILAFASLFFLPDPVHNIGLLMAGSFVVNFFVAFQDVATDGMAVDILKPEEQSRATSFMFAGQALGAALTTAVGAAIMRDHGIGVASLICSLFVVLIILLPLFSRERPGEKILPWTRGDTTKREAHEHPDGWKDIFVSLFSFGLMKYSLIFSAAMLCFSLARGLHISLMPVYYVQTLGWTDTANSNLESLSGLVGAIVTMIIGGTIIHKFDRVNFFTTATVLLALNALAMALVPFVPESEALLRAYRFAFAILGTLATVSIIAVAMSVCGRKVAATQFAIYMALGNVGLSFGAPLIGPLRAALPDNTLFIIFAALVGIATLILRFVNLSRHTDDLARREGRIESTVPMDGSLG